MTQIPGSYGDQLVAVLSGAVDALSGLPGQVFALGEAELSAEASAPRRPVGLRLDVLPGEALCPVVGDDSDCGESAWCRRSFGSGWLSVVGSRVGA